MGYKSALVKIAINRTPKSLILWVANKVLKDIAELKDFQFDISEKKIYTEVHLVGEVGTIDVLIDDFVIINDERSSRMLIKAAESNRLWLDNALSKYIVGREWPIPEKYSQLVCEVLGTEDHQETNTED